MYNYKEEVKRGVEIWIRDNWNFDPAEDYEDVRIELSDEMWVDDNITGNGKDFYASEEDCFNYLSGNFDLLYEAAQEFCMDDDINSLIHHYEHKSLAQYFDCTIRCYLLDECIAEVLEELYAGTNIPG